MLKNSPLGHTTVYEQYYNPKLLFPIPRSLARDKSGITHPLPFDGFDIWNGYEISWLNKQGKPQIGIAKITIPCTSPNIIESKSMKLYFNSFNQSSFDSIEEVRRTIEKDFTPLIGTSISIELHTPSHYEKNLLLDFDGFCVDELDVETNVYHVEPKFLKTSSTQVEETLYTDLFKSNCLATGQPDWGSVLIRYVGNKIDREGLLKYFISYRNHSGFAEHCVEHLFKDLIEHCKPEKLTVYGRYTRRGGLDINPFRSNFETIAPNHRQTRQ